MFMFRKTLKISFPIILISIIVLIAHNTYKNTQQLTESPITVIPTNASIILQLNDWRSYDPDKQNVVYFSEQNGTNVSFNLFDKSKNDRISLKRDKNYIFNIKYRAKGVGVTSNDYWMNEWSFVCDDIGKYIESGTTFFPTLNLAALGSNMEDVQSENFEDQVISQMNLGFYLER